ncbi:uncharacterized protein LOC143565672 [Bidens hawaiensis]|uniref:uncharacterized protein LOC143565672 n=1 Tax=Bidens hawaiensis TaxID=980011 RepID=UPI00404A442B
MYEREICGQWGWARAPSGQAEVAELRELLTTCQHLCLLEGEDSWVWDLDYGEGFSVKSLKEIFAINLGLEESHLFEWNNFVPKKVGILAWRAEMERIPVLFSLAKRGVEVESIICPVCEEDLETAEHMLVSCEFAQSIWSIISVWCKVPTIFAFSTRDLLELHKHALLSSRKAKTFHAVCLTTIWCLWCVRNRWVFERKPPRLRSVIAEIKFRNFCLLKGETVEELLTRFSHLAAEMTKQKMEPSQSDQIDTIKNSPSNSYSTFLLVLKENSVFKKEDLTALEFMQKIEERAYDMI